MKPKFALVSQFVFWSPRVLAILLAVFFSIFSLDVFGQNMTIWDTVLAFIMHNLPSLFILAVVYYSWRQEWIASVFFFALGIFFLYVLYSVLVGYGKIQITSYILIASILFLLSFLYLFNWVFRRKFKNYSWYEGKSK